MSTGGFRAAVRTQIGDCAFSLTSPVIQSDAEIVALTFWADDDLPEPESSACFLQGWSAHSRDVATTASFGQIVPSVLRRATWSRPEAERRAVAGVRLAVLRDGNRALDERSGDAGLLAVPPDPFRQQLVRGDRGRLLRQSGTRRDRHAGRRMSEDGGPVVLDADDRPAAFGGPLQCLLGAGGVGELALAVVVQDEQAKGRPAGMLGELEHR